MFKSVGIEISMKDLKELFKEAGENNKNLTLK
jgi:hypothetical protein